MDAPQLTLLEYCTKLKEHFAKFEPKRVWVTAEIGGSSVSKKGYRSYTLIQKSELSDEPVATINAALYYQNSIAILAKFRDATGRELQNGMKVMFLLSVEYSRRFGMKVIVYDVNPAYTIGEQEMLRRAIIQRLTLEGLMEMNRKVKLPFPTKRIAVVASPTSAGWGDFEKTLKSNPYGFVYHIVLFPSLMQGTQAPDSIIAALMHIAKQNFDAVVIIRGGGATTDLACFDSEPLARMVARYPLTVVSGVGHERDLTILDLVAGCRTSNPTDAANLFINQDLRIKQRIEQCSRDLELAISRAARVLAEKANQVEARFNNVVMEAVHRSRLEFNSVRAHLEGAVTISVTNNRNAINQLNRNLEAAVPAYIMTKRNLLEMNRQGLSVAAQFCLKDQKSAISSLERDVDRAIQEYIRLQRERIEQYTEKLYDLDPRRVLSRGYSILTVNGRTVKSVEELSAGDEVVTKMIDGEVSSTVNRLDKNDEQQKQ